MFDDLPLPKSDNTFPKNLEGMSIDDLDGYIQDLHEEITRVQEDIKQKKASIEAAASVFK